MELIADRCKNDYDNKYHEYSNCPSLMVQDRLKYDTWGGRPFDPNFDSPDVKRLNDICKACKEWDSTYKKLTEKIAFHCYLPKKNRCPEKEVLSSSIRYHLRKDSHRLDELCRPCRLFLPKRS